MYISVIKPSMDFLAALILLIIFSPILLVVTIALYYANNGMPFFLQERPGKNGVIFKIIKFKTMRDDADSYGNLLPDYQRVTSIGQFIRNSSLDELPQLFNVIKGEMSLIGPRPLLPEYLPLYNENQKRRHFVKPGITGWAQVNGRNAISWNDKFTYDIEYVKDLSLQFDLKILKWTIAKVIKKEDINANQLVTMEAFKGN